MNRKSLCMNLAALMALCTVSGCGGDSGPKLAPVSGTVTVGGKEPFKRGTVRFFPKPTATGMNTKLNAREAVTDDQGNFVMKFSGTRAGLEPGEYLVSFSLVKMPDGSPLPDQSKEKVQKSDEELGGVQWVPEEYILATSEKYPTKVTDKGNTGLKFDIPQLEARAPKKKK